jgi:chromosome segregation ATPase
MILLNTFLILAISIGLPELLIFQLGAIILGFTLHYFIAARKSLNKSVAPKVEQRYDENVDWKFKYFNDKEELENSIKNLKQELLVSQQKEEELSIELEEIEMKLKKTERIIAQTPKVVLNKQDNYLEELHKTQLSLVQHNAHITELVQQMEVLQEVEQKHQDTLQAKTILENELKQARNTIINKEDEIRKLKQTHLLNSELQDRLDKAYTEFSMLQNKLMEMERNIVKPNTRNIDFDNLQETYLKLSKDYDELKLKQISLMEENHRLLRLLADTDDKLREANFQRQQQNKRLNSMEEFNKDLQQVTERNKKLETHLKRLSEIEQMLSKATQQKNTNEG